MLFVAINSRDATITKLLMQAGADSFRIDGVNGTEARAVASIFHRSLAGHPFASECLPFFPVSKYIEEAEHSPLHLAALGVLHVDLATALQTPEYLSSINQLSTDKMTPLHFAVTRSDISTVKHLLRYGADPEVRGE
ncbi:hypothetical protein B0T14DRAFT_530393 [Immersiella caudata]|uniref:Uncharacterized protein n=1 Tax=Immersiella caudata TaxID=314043 RepID=A0AA39T1P8_9PEZI|nr:hypothetical protein B0T14DRAFT_530393 [Immersiella caudata]